MRPQRTPAKTPRRGAPRSNLSMDPVEVCCRLRNLQNDNDESCIEIIDEKNLRMTGADRKMECQFYRIFSPNVGQSLLFDGVAKPMIEGLIKGKNALLFTYGVTSSGKTYTMTGTVDSPGILPRSLDMLFNSLDGIQATKYSFVPDNMNGFSVQSEANAMLEKQEREILPRATTPMKTPNKNRTRLDVRYDIEYCRLETVNPDMRYSVFVSYVEIYNDYIYDLLEETQYDPFNRPKPPQSKRLREDKKHNMFVYGVVEVEIMTTEEAFAVFKRGQERRRIAHTQLNAESSRSHSIFNIRLVQAPLDPLGEDLLQDKSLVCISQLSLVDLAGSERLTRTAAGGERLREAGNINSSLMTLRRCLEQLRDNQKNGAVEMVKYRNSKVTHLFKMFFEGRGQVKMIVCVNPSAKEYEENVHVMQFAEMAQQVEVIKPEEFVLDRESIRKKAEEAKRRAEEERRREMVASRKLNSELSGNPLFQRGRRQVRRNLSATSQSSETETVTDVDALAWDAPDINLGTPLSGFELMDFADERTGSNLMSLLADRIQRREQLMKVAAKMETHFRLNISNCTQHDANLSQKLKECQTSLDEKCRDISRMEKQIKKLESKNQVLVKTTQVFENEKKKLNSQLAETELNLKESHLDNRKLDNRLRGTMANQKAQYEKQCEKKVRSLQTEMQEKMWVKEERLRQLKNIIAEGREGRPTARRTPVSTTSLATESSSGSSSRTSKISHKRRSRSAENLLSNTRANNKGRRVSSSEDLRPAKPKKSISSTIITESSSDTDTDSETEKETGRQTSIAKRMQAKPRRQLYPDERGEGAADQGNTKKCNCCNHNDAFSDTTYDSLLMEQENPLNLGCRYVNRNDEEKFRFRPAPPVAPKHRRSKSSSADNWLAHHPASTLQTDTILQPCIKPSKVVHIPSPKDIKNANKYLLTHQKEDKDGEIETQLIKGEVVHTRSGGQQVQFIDIETLKQKDPKKKTKKRESSPRKRKSDVDHDDLSSDEQSSWTDVETRCSFAIEHKAGTTGGAAILNHPKRRK